VVGSSMRLIHAAYRHERQNPARRILSARSG
jgi:hypothetical protein